MKSDIPEVPLFTKTIYSLPILTCPKKKPGFTISCTTCGNTQPIETSKPYGKKRQQKRKEIYISKNNLNSTVLIECNNCGAKEYI